MERAFNMWKKAEKGACVGVLASMDDLQDFKRNYQANHDKIERRLNNNTPPEQTV